MCTSSSVYVQQQQQQRRRPTTVLNSNSLLSSQSVPARADRPTDRVVGRYHRWTKQSIEIDDPERRELQAHLLIDEDSCRPLAKQRQVCRGLHYTCTSEQGPGAALWCGVGVVWCGWGPPRPDPAEATHVTASTIAYSFAQSVSHQSTTAFSRLYKRPLIAGLC